MTAENVRTTQYRAVPTPQYIGPYRIVEAIGRGGMGTVYRVGTPGGGVAALKVIRDDLLHEPEIRRRFTREARAVARLEHPNIARLLDFGTVDGRTFMTIEFVPGGSLADWRTHPPDGETLHQILDQVLLALAYAHARGVVHRDLKPENVLIGYGPDGKPCAKVMDFGVAHFRDDTTSETALNDSFVGTPAYMSPEQALHAANVGPAADLYAFGVMLHELVAGSLPFDARNSASMLMAHLRQEPPRLVPRPGYRLLGGIEQIVAHLLSKDPADRPLFAADVRREFAECRIIGQARTGEDRPGATNEELATVIHPVAVAAEPVEPAPQSQSSLVGLRELPFFGRDAELARLTGRADRAIAEQIGQFVLVGGEAGIGRSRLVARLREDLEEAGRMQAWTGRCLDAGDPDDGIRDAIRRGLGLHALPASEVFDRVAARLQRQGVSDERERQALLAFLHVEGRSSRRSEAERWALVERVLRRAAVDRPVLLTIEDAHLSDGAPFRLAEHLLGAETGEAGGWLVVITYRNTGEAGAHAARLASALATRSPGLVDNLVLGRFALRDAQRVVRESITVSTALAELIARRSEGNPASITELVRHVAESEHFGTGAHMTPEALLGDFADAAASARRQRIRDAAKGDADVLAVWERAAIVGLRFETSLLRAMLVQTELDDVDATMEWALTLGVTEGILVEDAPGTFAFENALLRDALVDRTIEMGTHVQLHLAAAHVLRHRHADNVDPVAHEIAAHIEMGGRPAEAVVWYVRAAEAAERGHSPHRALEAWTAAESLSASRGDAAVRTRALLHLGACHLQLAALEEAENCAVAARRAATLASLEEPCESTRLLAEVARRSGQNRLARERYRAAMAGFEAAGDRKGLARTHYSVGELDLAEGRLDEAERHLRQALALCEALGDRDGEAHAYWALGRTALGTGLYDEAAGYTAKSRYRHEQANNRHGAALCLLTLGEIAEQRDNHTEALDGFERAYAELGDVGDRHGAARALMHIGFVSDAAGNTPRAEVSLRDALRAFDAMGDRHASLLTLLGLARLHADQGAWDEADTELEAVFAGDAEERIDDSRFVRLLVATARLALFGGRTDLARRLLETASFKLSRIAHASPLYDAVDEVQYLLHELGDDGEGSGDGVVDFET